MDEKRCPGTGQSGERHARFCRAAQSDLPLLSVKPLVAYEGRITDDSREESRRRGLHLKEVGADECWGCGSTLTPQSALREGTSVTVKLDADDVCRGSAKSDRTVNGRAEEDPLSKTGVEDTIRGRAHGPANEERGNDRIRVISPACLLRRWPHRLSSYNGRGMATVNRNLYAREEIKRLLSGLVVTWDEPIHDRRTVRGWPASRNAENSIQRRRRPRAWTYASLRRCASVSSFPPAVW